MKTKVRYETLTPRQKRIFKALSLKRLGLDPDVIENATYGIFVGRREGLRVAALLYGPVSITYNKSSDPKRPIIIAIMGDDTRLYWDYTEGYWEVSVLGSSTR